MAVKSYSLDGMLLWKVSAEVRSSTDASVRVQKAKFGFETEDEAKRYESKLLRECEREALTRELKGSCWQAVVDAWMSFHSADGNSHLSHSTRLDYEAMLRNYTEQWFERPASELDRADVRDLLIRMKAEGRSRKHILKMKGLIHQVFVFGIETRLIKGLQIIPTSGMKIERIEEEKKPEILTIGQIRKLLVEARRFRSPWYYHWALAILTGMRSGELYALLWSDVNWENRVLSVNKSYNGRLKAIKSTKAGYWRSVPISKELKTLLEELKARELNSKFVLPRLSKWTKGEQAKELRKFCLGLNLPSIRFHTLRACFATQLIRNGVPAIQVMKICGWRDLKTMQQYIRLAGIEIDGATESLKVLPEDEVMNQAAELFMNREKHHWASLDSKSESLSSS